MSKRSSEGGQLTKDDYNGGETERGFSSEPQIGMSRASDEILSRRRMITTRKPSNPGNITVPTASSSVSPAASTNPFASVSLTASSSGKPTFQFTSTAASTTIPTAAATPPSLDTKKSEALQFMKDQDKRLVQAIGEADLGALNLCKVFQHFMANRMQGTFSSDEKKQETARAATRTPNVVLAPPGSTPFVKGPPAPSPSLTFAAPATTTTAPTPAGDTFSFGGSPASAKTPAPTSSSGATSLFSFTPQQPLGTSSFASAPAPVAPPKTNKEDTVAPTPEGADATDGELVVTKNLDTEYDVVETFSNVVVYHKKLVKDESGAKTLKLGLLVAKSPIQIEVNKKDSKFYRYVIRKQLGGLAMNMRVTSVQPSLKETTNKKQEKIGQFAVVGDNGNGVENFILKAPLAEAQRLLQRIEAIQAKMQ